MDSEWNGNPGEFILLIGLIPRNFKISVSNISFPSGPQQENVNGKYQLWLKKEHFEISRNSA